MSKPISRDFGSTYRPKSKPDIKVLPVDPKFVLQIDRSAAQEDPEITLVKNLPNFKKLDEETQGRIIARALALSKFKKEMEQ